MNNEQIKQAMESWYQEGYQAAAQSRDELIGKLINSFEQKVKNTPIGSECHQKSASFYNWGKYYLTILKGLYVESKEQQND